MTEHLTQDVNAALDAAFAEALGRGNAPGNGQSCGAARERKQADTLIELASAAELWHAPDAAAYVDIQHDGHRETWPLRSRGSRRWLLRRYYEQTQSAPSAQAMQDALGVLEARAHYDGPERNVHLRVAGHDGRIYLDLADATWRAVEVDADGWRIVATPPVRFRRAAGMLALPAPVSGGSLNALRSLLNVRSTADYVLIVSWLLAAVRERGPYPVLGLTGEAGTAKTTCAEMLRSLIDPSATATRSPPREDRDLMIAASNGHVIALDNVSAIPAWLSDALCRLATGGGYATRQLYSDTDEVLLALQRPIIITAIEDVISRGDLADRSICVTLAPIPERHRRPDAEMRSALDTARPALLGALLDVIAHGLRRLPHMRLDSLPRMADFAVWVAACERALWPEGTFAAAYAANRDASLASVMDADEVAIAVATMMADRGSWSGPAKALLAVLSDVVAENTRRHRDWPATPRALSGALRRAAPILRGRGIDITPPAPSDKTRTWHISPPKQPEPPKPSDTNDLQSGGAAAPQPERTARQLDSPPVALQQPNRTSLISLNLGDPGGRGGRLPAYSVSGDRCDHCGGPATAADPLAPYDWRGRPDGIWLHSRCEGPWIDSEARL